MPTQITKLHIQKRSFCLKEKKHEEKEKIHHTIFFSKSQYKNIYNGLANSLHSGISAVLLIDRTPT